MARKKFNPARPRKPKGAVSAAGKATLLFKRLREIGGDDIAILAIDPDLHCPAWSLRTKRLGLWRFGCGAVTPSLKGQDAVPEVYHTLRGSLRGPVLPPRVLIVMEGQAIRTARGHETQNPKSIVDLATAAGAAMGAAMAAVLEQQGSPVVMFVQAQQWKGSVPKQIHQLGIADREGWTDRVLHGENPKTGYVEPRGPFVGLGSVEACASALRASDWKHVMDAIGLGQWAGAQLWAHEP